MYRGADTDARTHAQVTRLLHSERGEAVPDLSVDEIVAHYRAPDATTNERPISEETRRYLARELASKSGRAPYRGAATRVLAPAESEERVVEGDDGEYLFVKSVDGRTGDVACDVVAYRGVTSVVLTPERLPSRWTVVPPGDAQETRVLRRLAEHYEGEAYRGAVEDYEVPARLHL